MLGHAGNSKSLWAFFVMCNILHLCFYIYAQTAIEPLKPISRAGGVSVSKEN